MKKKIYKAFVKLVFIGGIALTITLLLTYNSIHIYKYFPMYCSVS